MLKFPTGSYTLCRRHGYRIIHNWNDVLRPVPGGPTLPAAYMRDPCYVEAVRLSLGAYNETNHRGVVARLMKKTYIHDFHQYTEQINDHVHFKTILARRE